MSTIFHLGAFQAFFLASLIFSKSQKQLSDFILGGWLILMALNIMFSHFIMHHHNNHPDIFIVFNYSILFLHAPLFYLYLTSILKAINRFNAKNLLHFLPFLMVNILFFIIPFKGIEAIKESGIFDSSALIELVSFVVFIISIPLYVYYAFIQINKYDAFILNKYSSIEEISFSWLRKCNYGILAVWLVFILGIILEYFIQFERFGSSINYTLYTLAIFIFFIGYFGFRQTNVFSGVTKNNKSIVPGEELKGLIEHNDTENSGNEDETELKTELSDEIKASLINCLQIYMDEKKPYLNSKLTIRELASNVNIPVNHLSRIINSELKQNFFDFINMYRVNEFKKQLDNNQDKKFTLLALAYNSGFNSKSSFNNIFKKHTGLTPTEYINSLDL